MIIPRLADPDPDVRWKTVLALAQYGPPASNAIPALLKALNDPERRVARLAQGAIRRINSNALNRASSP